MRLIVHRMRGHALLVLCLTVTAARAQTVSVTTTGTSRAIAPYFLGYNTQTTVGPSWSDPQFLSAMPQLEPEALRYPGGTNGNYWDWQTGWFLPGTAPNNGRPPNPYRLGDLKNAVELTGATPDFMLNVMTSDLPTQLSLLRTAQSMGLPVALIELGNEFSLSVMPDYITHFPAGADYGAVANQWVAAIKSEFPQARIAISTRTGVSWTGGSPREQTWNQEVLGGVHGADAIVMHNYPAIDAQFNVALDGTQPETAAQQTAETAALQDPSAPARVLGVPFDTFAQVESNIQSLPATFTPAMTIWVTEYNLNRSFNAAHGTWLHALFVSLLTALYLQEPRIELVEYFNLCDNAIFAAIFSSNNAFMSFLSPPVTQTYGLSAPGVALREFGLAIRGMSSAQPLAFTPSPMVARPSGTPYPALIGWSFFNGARRSAVILNLSGSAVSADLGTPTMRPVWFEQASADPLMRGTGFGGPTLISGAAAGSIMLRPYSVTRLGWGFPRRRAVKR